MILSIGCRILGFRSLQGSETDPFSFRTLNLNSSDDNPHSLREYSRMSRDALLGFRRAWPAITRGSPQDIPQWFDLAPLSNYPASPRYLTEFGTRHLAASLPALSLSLHLVSPVHVRSPAVYQHETKRKAERKYTRARTLKARTNCANVGAKGKAGVCGGVGKRELHGETLFGYRFFNAGLELFISSFRHRTRYV